MEFATAEAAQKVISLILAFLNSNLRHQVLCCLFYSPCYFIIIELCGSLCMHLYMVLCFIFFFFGSESYVLSSLLIYEHIKGGC